MNKKGMVGSLISIFVMIVIGITMYGTLSQEMDNIINCNVSDNAINTSDKPITLEKPLGKTDSFGGGGSGRFGGYDGKVTKSWGSNLAVIKTEKSLINPNCDIKLSEGMTQIANLVPIFFIIAVGLIIVVMLSQTFRGLGEAGMLSI